MVLLRGGSGFLIVGFGFGVGFLIVGLVVGFLTGGFGFGGLGLTGAGLGGVGLDGAGVQVDAGGGGEATKVNTCTLGSSSEQLASSPAIAKPVRPMP